MTGNSFAGGMQITDAKAPAPPAAPPQTHETYPMVMVHPHARKAEIKGVPGSEKRNPITGEILPGQFWSYGGAADFMPPVTVQNADQEAMHYAQGYRRGGVSDVAAFNNMAAGATAMPGPIEEYPKWVNGVLCANAEEETAASGETAASASGALGSIQEDATPKPRHVASPKKPPTAKQLAARAAFAQAARDRRKT